MHHVALDRAGPDDRHLDDQIVEGPRLDAAAASPSAPGSRSGRCRACRPCGSSRRCAGPRPGWWRDRARCPCARPADRSARRMQASMPRPSTSTFMNLSASMSSLSHSITCAVRHRGRLDRHQLVEPVVGQHEAAGMLRQMARRADQLAGELERQAQAPVVEVEVQLGRVLRLDAFACSSPRPGEDSAPVRSSGRPSALPTRAPRLGAVADHGRAQGRAVAAVGLVNPLDDLSRRSCSKSTSMSGGSRRSSLTKRSNSRSLRSGSIEVMPST